jgi:Nudix N-terminal
VQTQRPREVHLDLVSSDTLCFGGANTPAAAQRQSCTSTRTPNATAVAAPMALASLSQRGGVEILRIAMCGARGVQRCCHLRCSSSGSSGSSSSHPMPDGLTVSASAASPPPPPTPASRLQQQPHQPASAPPPPPRLSQNCRFCRSCGGSMHIVQPEGDKAWRHVCKECGYIDYVNPKLVVGCIVEHAGKILLCRRCALA